MERFPNQVYPYDCKVEGISTETGREQVHLRFIPKTYLSGSLS